MYKKQAKKKKKYNSVFHILKKKEKKKFFILFKIVLFQCNKKGKKNTEHLFPQHHFVR